MKGPARFGFWLLALAAAPILVILLYRLLPPPVTPLMLIRAADGMAVQKRWLPLEAMPQDIFRAVIASEDDKFCTHHGFDWQAIDTDYDRYQAGEGRLRGASTISMQTAKNLFLWPGRTFLRKGIEAYLTTWLELFWPKWRIIEVYLNIVEWGPGIYGLEAAAQYHFHHGARSLTPREAALLAAILPSPLKSSAARPSASIAARAAMIEGRMPGAGESKGCWIRRG